MTVTVEMRAPQVRCYECGWAGIPALCHHCWRPGCANHVHPAPRWTERLFGKEGSGTGLENEQAYHCADCAHFPAGRGLAVGMAGLAAVAAGIVVIWLNLITGLVLLLVGVTLTVGACCQVRRRADELRAGMPVPVRPKASDLCLVEKVRVRIILGADGGYQVDPGAVEGEVTMALVFGRADRERLDRRMKKRPRPADRDMQFTAGRLVLKGPAGIKAGQDVPGPIIALEGSTSSYPVFRAENPHVSSLWSLKLRYQLSDEPDLSSGVVWITPSIVPESDQRALELDIQWTELAPDGRPLSVDVIDLLELRLPANWGKVEQVSQRAIQGILPEDPDGQRIVRWKQLAPSEEERQSGRLTLAVRFEKKIRFEEPIHGRLEATMTGTLSGVDGVRLYGPLGKRRSMPVGRARTRAEVDFDLSLASIRYQAVRIVPRHTEDDASGYRDEFGVIPDDKTVIELTNEMSALGYYVKRVIENPPRSGGRADHVHRYWDIAGRLYEGVYPIDFHMVLTGEEVHRGDVQPESGTTKVRITVKGAYTNDEMSARVEDAWKSLCLLTEKTLKRQERTARPPPRAPADGAMSNDGRVPQDSAISPPEPGPTRPATPKARLLQRLGKLDEALVDQRISQKQYTEMRKRAEEEFGES
jgi:hypothetical protein